MIDIWRYMHTALMLLKCQSRRIPAIGEQTRRVVDGNAQIVAQIRPWSAVLFVWRGAAFRFPTVTYANVYVVGVIVFSLYFAICWSSTGRTYGDHVLGLRVVNRHGDRLGFAYALLRAVLCVHFPFLLFWAVVDHRSVQDVVLRTSVIHDWESTPRRALRDDQATRSG